MSTKYRTAARRSREALGRGWLLAAAVVLMTGCVVDTTDESDVDEWVDQQEDVGDTTSELLSHDGPSSGNSNTDDSHTSNPCGALGNGNDPDPEPWVGPPVTGGPPVGEDEEQAKEPGQAP